MTHKRKKPVKVLVVEDEATSRILLTNAVEGLGHIAIQASKGSLGWWILNDNQDIKLIITDLAMPEMSGQEFVRAVRGNDRVKDIPIIIVSGVVKLSEISTVLELGASRFLPKPINTKELRFYIKNFAESQDPET